MNKRSFLKFLGLAPAVPVAAKAVAAIPEAPNFTARLRTDVEEEIVDGVACSYVSCTYLSAIYTGPARFHGGGVKWIQEDE